MKKIINRPEDIVMELCHGMVLAHPGLQFDEDYKIIARRRGGPGKVRLISGGGSGHEPAHAGYVGLGMLDAAVCGDVFASPSQIQIYNAIRAVADEKGVLLIVKNYSGDVMNFKNAAALAREDGIQVDYVIVDDDIAVQDSLYTVGRRGVAGTIFVHKIAGAAAQRGFDLARVKELAEKTVANVRSIGFALTSCTVPAKGSPTFSLGEDEMEYGVGIHGEPGIRREGLLSADELGERMTQSLIRELALSNGDEVAVLINGLGGTPAQELYLLNRPVQRLLAQENIRPVLTLVGNYMTSLDMAGASISVLKLDAQLRELLFDPCDTAALSLGGPVKQTGFYELRRDQKASRPACYTVETDPSFAVVRDNRLSLENIIYLVDVMSDCIIRNEIPFCELDAHAGDGDFGMSVAKGFRKLKESWGEIAVRPASIGDFLRACSMIIMEHCGGASGPIWGSAFRAGGLYAGARASLTDREAAQLLQRAVAGIQATGERSFGRGAVVGDKTLMDALIPCADTWSRLAGTGLSMSELFEKGAQAAVEGAKKTEDMVARMGRAGTAGQRSLGYPDAGAHALGIIFTQLSDALKQGE